MAELRWGPKARVKAPIGVETVKVGKSGRAAKVEAKVSYSVVRDPADGEGPADDTVRAKFRVTVDDITAEKPRATSLKLVGVENWKA